MKFLDANEPFCQFIGYDKFELRKLTIADITHPDDREETHTQVEEIRTGTRQSIGLEKRYVRKDGTQIGRVYRTVEKDVRSVVFHLNKDGSQVAQELMEGNKPLLNRHCFMKR